MRKLILVASALAVVGGTASGGEVFCGKDWISFEPLSPEGFSEEPGLNSYLVRKSDIRWGNARPAIAVRLLDDHAVRRRARRGPCPPGRLSAMISPARPWPCTRGDARQ